MFASQAQSAIAGESQWRVVTNTRVGDRPQPAHVSSAVQLGLLPSPGMPRLVDSLLPRTNRPSPAACRRWIQSQLLNPPPYHVARRLAQAAYELVNLQAPLTKTVPMSASRVARLLRDQEASALCFLEIWRMLVSTSRALHACPIDGAPAGYKTAALNCLFAAADESGLPFSSAEEMARKCSEVAAQIAAVVLNDMDADENPGSGVATSTAPTTFADRDREIMLRLFERTEGWRGRIRISAAPEAYAKVAEASANLCRIVHEDFGQVLSGTGGQLDQMAKANPALRGAASNGPPAATAAAMRAATASAPRQKPQSKTVVALHYDYRDNTVWLSGPVKQKAAQFAKLDLDTLCRERDVLEEELAMSTAAVDAPGSMDDAIAAAKWSFLKRKELTDTVAKIGLAECRREDDAGEIEFIHPRDRWNKVVQDKWSTSRVEQAQYEYRRACHEANAEINQVLRDLAARIADPVKNQMHDVLLACHFSLVFRSMTEHARAAALTGWALPELVPDSNDAGATRALELRAGWPYWIDKGAAVPNDLSLNGMTLLTGPNMAGKSTIARTIASIALLAHCGFYAPCKAARVPQLDSICLRMSGGDSPAEGKSGFAVEMIDVHAILRDATDKSLVLLDEVGRGTELRAGTAVRVLCLFFWVPSSP